MKVLLLLLSLFFILSAMMIGEIQEQPTPEDIAFEAEETRRYEAGPQYGMGCYRIVEKSHPLYGCTFFSSQGAMFITENVEGKRNHGEWRMIWNKKIRCLGDGTTLFVKESDIKPTNCPESLYKEE